MGRGGGGGGVREVVGGWEEKMKKDAYCKEDVEKYMFLVRGVVLGRKEHPELPSLVLLALPRCTTALPVSAGSSWTVAPSTTPLTNSFVSSPTYLPLTQIVSRSREVM